MAESDKDDLISIIEEDIGDTDIPTSLPLLPVRDVVIFTDPFDRAMKEARKVLEGYCKFKVKG